MRALPTQTPARRESSGIARSERSDLPSRFKPVILVVLLAGLAIFGASSAYYLVAAQRAAVPATASLRSPAGSGHSFILHEAPQPVPELAFVSGEGRQLSLAEFRGRTILLNVWATWCVPCREEMPALERLQERLGSPEFEVVPLSIDRGGAPRVVSFYENLGLTALGIYVDASGKAGYTLAAVGIPTTLLVNSEGLETGRLVGAAEWDSPDLIEIIQRQLDTTARMRAEPSTSD